MRLMRYDFAIVHVAGKDLVLADTLSRAPIAIRRNQPEAELEEEAELCINSVVEYLPATDACLQKYLSQQQQDTVCQELVRFTRDGWPPHAQLRHPATSYSQYSGDFSMSPAGLLLKGERIVVPESLRGECLQQIHEGHLGISKCRERAKTAVWWPGMSRDIERFVDKCPECATKRPTPTEPLSPTALPERPWQKVATDLFQFEKNDYVLIVDYFSRFIEYTKLDNTTSTEVIKVLKAIFSRQGIPEEIRSDNGPQYSSKEFRVFCQDWGIRHTTSSPRYPQSNGLAERTVRTAKSMLKHNADPLIALLNYHDSPLPSGQCPAELCLGRRLRTRLPAPNLSGPSVTAGCQGFRHKESFLKQKQKEDHDRSHRARTLPELEPGARVWLPESQATATVSGSANKPRSYLVSDGHQVLQRNRRHLVSLSEPSEDQRHQLENEDTPNEETVKEDRLGMPTEGYTTRSGRRVKAKG